MGSIPSGPGLVLAIDQETADALGAEFGEGDFLRAGGHFTARSGDQVKHLQLGAAALFSGSRGDLGHFAGA